MKNIFLNKERNIFLGKGRIRRRHYILANMLLLPCLYIVVGINHAINNIVEFPIQIQYLVSVVALIFYYWISIGLVIMRSHDIGNSGWYILIPFYGLLLILVDSERGTNQYGQNPKGNNGDK